MPAPIGSPRRSVVFARAQSCTLRDPQMYEFAVVQIWFRNEPKRADVVAESLTAFLTFFENEIPLFPEIRGKWADANAADNVGFNVSRETLDRLQPNGELAKLLIVHKRINEEIAFAWSKGAAEYQYRRHPSHTESCPAHLSCESALHQAMTVQDGVDRADGRTLQRGTAPPESLTDLRRKRRVQ
jgi:hypothetical protein